MRRAFPSLLSLLAAASLPGATILWDNLGDGNWEDAGNWIPAQVPSASDATTIGQTGPLKVTINSSAVAHSLTTQINNNVYVASGSLELQALSNLSGGFGLSDLTKLHANGATVNLLGTTSLDGGNLNASSGGIINAANVTNYTGYTGFVSNEFTANGGQINLINLATMTGNTAASTVTKVEASNAGSINLSGLTTVTGGRVAFKANGANSQINLTSLQSLNHTGNLQSELTALNGGEILLPTSGIKLITTNIQLDALSTLDVSGIENYNGGTAFIDGTGVTFSGLLNGDGTGFSATSGATIDLSTLTDYNGSTAAVQTTITADGFGSAIYLDQVSTLTGNTFASTRTIFSATDGGLIDLSNLDSIDGGGTQFTADGTDSLIDLSALTSIVNTVNIGGEMSATNGGEILLGQADIIADQITLHYDGTGIFDLNAFSEWRNGTLDISAPGTTTFSTLTNINGSNIIASPGTSLVFPLITSYSGYTGFANSFISADNSSIDLSGVTSFTGNTAASTQLVVSASNGGTVDLSQVATVNPSKTTFVADGSGSLIKLHALTSMTHSGNSESGLAATDGGRIDFGASSPTLNDVSIFLSSGGRVTTTGLITLLGGTLAGNGEVEADLTIEGGFISPGESAGSVGSTENLEIGNGTIYVWELGALLDESDGTAGIDWDLVTGKTISFLSGSQIGLDFGLVAAPDSGDPFWSIAHTWTIAQAGVSLDQADATLIDPGYANASFTLGSNGTQVQLHFNPVPEPSTYALALLGASLTGLWFWRRRQS